MQQQRHSGSGNSNRNSNRDRNGNGDSNDKDANANNGALTTVTMMTYSGYALQQKTAPTPWSSPSCCYHCHHNRCRCCCRCAKILAAMATSTTTTMAAAVTVAAMKTMVATVVVCVLCTPIVLLGSHTEVLQKLAYNSKVEIAGKVFSRQTNLGSAKHTLCGIVLFKLNTFLVMFLSVPSIDSTCFLHT